MERCRGEPKQGIGRSARAVFKCLSMCINIGRSENTSSEDGGAGVHTASYIWCMSRPQRPCCSSIWAHSFCPCTNDSYAESASMLWLVLVRERSLLVYFLKIFIVAVENVIQARSWENTYRYSLEVASTAPGASSSSVGAVESGAASSSRARSSSEV